MLEKEVLSKEKMYCNSRSSREIDIGCNEESNAEIRHTFASHGETPASPEANSMGAMLELQWTTYTVAGATSYSA